MVGQLDTGSNPSVCLYLVISILSFTRHFVTFFSESPFLKVLSLFATIWRTARTDVTRTQVIYIN